MVCKTDKNDGKSGGFIINVSKKCLRLSQKWGKIYLKVERSGVKWSKMEV